MGVKEVLDTKHRYRSLWFYVRFKGYNESHDKWVKQSDLFADEAIAEFYRKYPNKPQNISRASFDSLPFRDPSADVRYVHSLRRGAAVQRGGDVRGTPPSHPPTSAPPDTNSAPPVANSDSPVASPPAPDTPAPPTPNPHTRRSHRHTLLRFHRACDAARDLCTSLRARAASQ